MIKRISNIFNRNTDIVLYIGLLIWLILSIYRSFNLYNEYIYPNYDPSFAYFYSGLSIIENGTDHFIGHPGLTLKFEYLISHLIFESDHSVFNFVKIIHLTLLIIVFLLFLKKKWLIELILLTISSRYTYSFIILPNIDSLYFIISLYLIYFIYLYNHNSKNKYLFIISFLSALLISTKFYGIIWLFFFFFYEKSILEYLKYLIITTFLLAILWAIPFFESPIYIIKLAFTTLVKSDIYGSGTDYGFSVFRVLKTIKKLYSDPIFICSTFILLFIFLKNNFKYRPNKMRAYIFSILYFIVSLILIKNGDIKYLLPFSIMLLIPLLSLHNTQPPTYINTVVVILVYLNLLLSFRNMHIFMTNFEENEHLNQDNYVINSFGSSSKEYAHFFGIYFNNFKVKSRIIFENQNHYYAVPWKLDKNYKFNFKSNDIYDYRLKQLTHSEINTLIKKNKTQIIGNLKVN